MRLLICAGMTGGGIYPALAVHQALAGSTEATLWVGSQNGLEQDLLAPFNISYRSISGGGVHGLSLPKLPRNALELLKGYLQAKEILGQFKPDVIFFTGGYIGVPVALASKHIPMVVFIPDTEPGLALQVILRKANRVAVSTTQTIKFLKVPEKAIVTGYPVRGELKSWTRETARKFFEISASEKVILVFGGSKGARSLNEALLPQIAPLTTAMHVIHITGVENWDACKTYTEAHPLAQPEKYHAFPYLHNEMGAAFSAADLAVCRAGASTMGELPYFGLPAILVPYPHAWRYQYQNAEYLVSHGGAVLLEDNLLKNDLAKTIMELIQDQERLDQMKEKMGALANQDAAGSIADIVRDAGAGEIKGSES